MVHFFYIESGTTIKKNSAIICHLPDVNEKVEESVRERELTEECILWT